MMRKWDQTLQCLIDAIGLRGRCHTEKDEQITTLIKAVKMWVMGHALWMTGDGFRNDENRDSLSNQLWYQ